MDQDLMARVMDSDQPVYPEHERLALVTERSQAIGDFLEWASGKGYHLLKWHEFEDGADYIPFPPVVKMLAEFFDIDLDKIEREKRAMLDYMRGANAQAQEG